MSETKKSFRNSSVPETSPSARPVTVTSVGVSGRGAAPRKEKALLKIDRAVPSTDSGKVSRCRVTAIASTVAVEERASGVDVARENVGGFGGVAVSGCGLDLLLQEVGDVRQFGARQVGWMVGEYGHRRSDLTAFPIAQHCDGPNEIRPVLGTLHVEAVTVDTSCEIDAASPLYRGRVGTLPVEWARLRCRIHRIRCEEKCEENSWDQNSLDSVQHGNLRHRPFVWIDWTWTGT